MYLTGVSNIRDVELHPRTTGNADFLEAICRSYGYIYLWLPGSGQWNKP